MGQQQPDVQLATRCGQVRAALALADRRRAEALAREASRALRSREDFWVRLASHALAAREHELVVRWAKQALKINARSCGASLLCAQSLLRTGEAERAGRHLARILEHQPRDAAANGLMAHVSMSKGDFDGAIAFLERSTAVPKPDPRHLSHHLSLLNFNPRLSPRQVSDAHRALGDVLTGLFGGKRPPASGKRAGGAKRIGFVSGDFRGHAVAFFVNSLLPELRRQGVETFAYYNHDQNDAETEKLKHVFSRWRNVRGVPTTEATGFVRADGIDVLVDLSGHTDAGRLDLFLHRPAPVQLTWLGYPNTTGLGCFDGRIVDSTTDPLGSEHLATEPLLRLDPCFLLYAPPGVAPPVVAPPCLTKAGVTFGSFNNFSKLNDDVVDLWAAILREVRGSSLALKSSKPRGAADRGRILEAFAQRAVEASRIVFLDRCFGLQEHLSRYALIDVALDPFPYNGTTTTCEALWMGVPVVALVGDRHAARVSASILRAVGLEACAATSRDEYVLTAALLAGSPHLLAELRGSLREGILRSPLCDAASFTSKFIGLMEQRLAEAAGGGGERP
jgi:tetratricopeptide (TPR) repeat protein